MPAPTPEEVAEHFRRRDLSKRSYPWGQLTVFIIAVGVVGWFGYTHWLYRLPQDRDLVLSDGKTLSVHLVARNGMFLKVALAGNDEVHYLPITSLSLDDQKFISHLSITPRSMSSGYPLNYTLTGAPQAGAKVKFQGRTEDFVKYQDVEGGSVHYVPMATLSPTDQSIVQFLDPVMATEYPVAYTLTTADGQSLPGAITGRGKTVVALTMPGSDLPRYFPIADLSPTDQKLVNVLPFNVNFYLPLDCTVFDKQGKLVQLHIASRTPTFIQLKDPSNGTVTYRQLADFSAEDQKALQQLEAGSLPSYAFEYTLTDQIGRNLPVMVEGRSTSEVEFHLANGTLVRYALDKLSTDNQAFLRALPINLSEDTLLIKNLREHIANLQQQDLHLQSVIADPGTSSGEKEVSKAQLARNQKEISSDNYAILAEQKKLEIKNTP